MTMRSDDEAIVNLLDVSIDGVRLVAPNDAQRDFLDACARARCVLEFEFLAAADAFAETAHRAAALLAVAATLSRVAHYHARALVDATDPERRRTHTSLQESALAESQRVLALPPARLRGAAVDADVLFGPLFDRRTRTVYRMRTGQRGHGPYRPARGGEAVTFDRTPGDMGLADAFLEPPYGLAGTPEEIESLFLRCARDVLGVVDRGSAEGAPRLLERASAFHFVGDFSSYFDAGNEWWGAHVWAIATSPCTLVAVCASSTD